MSTLTCIDVEMYVAPESDFSMYYAVNKAVEDAKKLFECKSENDVERIDTYLKNWLSQTDQFEFFIKDKYFCEQMFKCLPSLSLIFEYSESGIKRKTDKEDFTNSDWAKHFVNVFFKVKPDKRDGIFMCMILSERYQVRVYLYNFKSDDDGSDGYFIARNFGYKFDGRQVVIIKHHDSYGCLMKKIDQNDPDFFEIPSPNWIGNDPNVCLRAKIKIRHNLQPADGSIAGPADGSIVGPALAAAPEQQEKWWTQFEEELNVEKNIIQSNWIKVVEACENIEKGKNTGSEGINLIPEPLIKEQYLCGDVIPKAYNVSSQTLRCLRGASEKGIVTDKYLNSDVLMWFMHLVHKAKETHQAHIDSLQLMDSEMFQSMHNQEQGEMGEGLCLENYNKARTKWICDHIFKGIKRVAMPVFRNHHWMMAVVDKDQQKHFVYDPYGLKSSSKKWKPLGEQMFRHPDRHPNFKDRMDLTEAGDIMDLTDDFMDTEDSSGLAHKTSKKKKTPETLLNVNALDELGNRWKSAEEGHGPDAHPEALSWPLYMNHETDQPDGFNCGIHVALEWANELGWENARKWHKDPAVVRRWLAKRIISVYETNNKEMKQTITSEPSMRSTASNPDNDKPGKKQTTQTTKKTNHQKKRLCNK